MNKLEKLKAFLDVMGIGYLDSKESGNVDDNQIVVQFDFLRGRSHFAFFAYEADTDGLSAYFNIGPFDERPSTLYAFANKINLKYDSRVKACINDSNCLIAELQISYEAPRDCYMCANAFAKVLSEEIEKNL